MLFNSYVFLFGFLPLPLLLFRGLRRLSRACGAVFVLAAMSLAYYGWWSWKYLLLLIPLMLVNYIFARRMVNFRERQRPRAAKRLLTLGLSINLAALGYYKYGNLFVDNINALLGLDLFLATIVLPLGISFFTFQKIALLVDVYYGKVAGSICSTIRCLCGNCQTLANGRRASWVTRLFDRPASSPSAAVIGATFMSRKYRKSVSTSR